MASLRKSKRGLSQVVTTLILLVVSVLLAGIVTYYATNITMIRTQQEEVQLIYSHCWVNSSDTSEVAFYLKNVGGRDILIDKVTVRGVESIWDNVYFNDTTRSEDLEFVNFTDLVTYGLAQADDDIPVESSGVRIIYVKNPGNIDLTDVGTPVSITVFTVNGQWIEEVMVEYAGS